MQEVTQRIQRKMRYYITMTEGYCFQPLVIQAYNRLQVARRFGKTIAKYSLCLSSYEKATDMAFSIANGANIQYCALNYIL